MADSVFPLRFRNTQQIDIPMSHGLSPRGGAPRPQARPRPSRHRAKLCSRVRGSFLAIGRDRATKMQAREHPSYVKGITRLRTYHRCARTQRNRNPACKLSRERPTWYYSSAMPELPPDADDELVAAGQMTHQRKTKTSSHTNSPPSPVRRGGVAPPLLQTTPNASNVQCRTSRPPT